MTGLFTFGETMGLVAADGIGPLAHARGFSLSIGGAESNVAIGVARLGGAATWLGRIGPDATGTLITTRLTAAGVRTLAIADTSFTGLMVRHRRSGEFAHVDYHRAGSAGSRLGPADIPADEIRAAAVLHVTGITPALSDSARAAVFQAVETARAAGVPVSIDVNYRAKLWSRFDAAPVLRDLVAKADIVFAGPAEAALFVDRNDPLTGLAALGPAEVIVKDGGRGCEALIDGKQYSLPALPVTVIDPVGAGDAFVAGYLADRLLGADPTTRLTTAIAAGAFAVNRAGRLRGRPRPRRTGRPHRHRHQPLTPCTLHPGFARPDPHPGDRSQSPCPTTADQPASIGGPEPAAQISKRRPPKPTVSPASIGGRRGGPWQILECRPPKPTVSPASIGGAGAAPGRSWNAGHRNRRSVRQDWGCRGRPGRILECRPPESAVSPPGLGVPGPSRADLGMPATGIGGQSARTGGAGAVPGGSWNAGHRNRRPVRQDRGCRGRPGQILERRPPTMGGSRPRLLAVCRALTDLGRSRALDFRHSAGPSAAMDWSDVPDGAGRLADRPSFGWNRGDQARRKIHRTSGTDPVMPGDNNGETPDVQRPAIRHGPDWISHCGELGRLAPRSSPRSGLGFLLWRVRTPSAP